MPNQLRQTNFTLLGHWLTHSKVEVLLDYADACVMMSICSAVLCPFVLQCLSLSDASVEQQLLSVHMGSFASGSGRTQGTAVSD